MKTLLSAAAALALTVTAATADVVIPSGYWEAFRTKNDDTGNTICGMRTSSPNGSAIMVKYVEGDASILVQVLKPTWSFPADRTIELQLTVGFDANSQVVKAKGYMTRSTTSQISLPFVEFRLNSGIDDFLREFADANTMWLEFPEGNEGRWTAKMVGSRKTAQLFRGCTLSVLDRLKSATQPTQPYGNKPTQPYGSKPTQPYGTPKPPSQPVRQKADDGSV